MRFSSKNFISFLLFSLSASTSVLADVKLSAENGIYIIAVNGVELESDSLIGNKLSAQLPNGVNQILVRYSAEIETFGDIEIENSNPHIIVFKAQDNSLKLSAPEIKRMSEFDEFDNGQQWLLTDSAGRSISYKSKPLIKEGFQLSRDYVRELNDFNRSGDELSINYLPSDMRDSAKQAESKSVVISYKFSDESIDNKKNVNLPEQLLQYWYLKADAETRERFKDWISDK